jgi:cation:H+ antiporter
MFKFLTEETFRDLGQPMLLLICAVSLLALIKGADFLVEGIAAIAYRLRISKAVVAATVLSLGTTSPETAVSVMAAWSGSAGLALGNAVGSATANAALIFGLGCVMGSLPTDRFVLRRQAYWQIGAALLLSGACYLSFMMNGHTAALHRWQGLGLLALVLPYLYLSVKWGRQTSQNQAPLNPKTIDAPASLIQQSLAVLILLSLGGLVVILLSSRLFVVSILMLSRYHWFIPEVIIAATIVSVGTSLPELVISLTSVRKGQGEVLVGNVIGANVLNLLWVAGWSAIVAPLPLFDPLSKHPAIFLTLHLPAVLITLSLFTLFILGATHRGRFARWNGVPMLVIYVVYVVTQFVLG